MQILHNKRERAGLLIIVLGIAIAIAISSFVVGLLGAAVLYVLCAPVHERLLRRMRPSFAAPLTLIFAILVIAVPVMWIVVLVADQAPEMLKSAQNSGIFSKLSAVRIGRFDVGAEVAKASGTFLSWVSQQAFDVVGGAARATLNLVISFFALYYMLVSADTSWRVFAGVLPFSQASADELKERFYSITHATVLGTALTSLAQGSLIGLGFMFVGIPNALFWGVVTGFASILPVLGSALVWLPATLMLLLQGRYGAAVVLIVIGGVIASNVDNVIRPLIYRRVSNIHPMVTLIGAFAGVKYFGLLGVLLGPLAIQYFFEFVRLYRKEYVGEGPAPAAPDELVA
ncbi:MAG: AI-2E family transporter [Cytophagaceae bacterium]|nr:AI-2E family transporter [Gemmatimonadaceae bacterium]